MKKSTLLYLSLHAVIMVIPLFFIVGLRYKIKTGEVTDLVAQEAARYKHIPMPDIHELEISSSDPKNKLSMNVILLDSINSLETDTSTYNYITCTVKDHKLIIHYDYVKDSLNRLYQNPERANRYNDDYVVEYDYPHITLYLKSNLSRVQVLNSNLALRFEKPASIKNDLSASCDYSTLTLHAPYLTENVEEENDEGFLELSRRVILQPFNQSLNVKLFNYSNLELENFASIKKFDLTLRNGSEVDEYVRAGEFNLSIDKESFYSIDVHELKNVKIKFE